MILTHRLPTDPTAVVNFTLSLTAEERMRSHHHFHTDEGQGIHLQLPRGTVLHHGDLLTNESREIVRVMAKPEPVMTVTAHTPLELLRAAYHLGNRHVPLEVAVEYLRFSTDSVLESMLIQMGLRVTEATLPFQPEAGAYQEQSYPQDYSHDRHASSHSHSYSH